MICICGPEWRNPECDEHGNASMECVRGPSPFRSESRCGQVFESTTSLAFAIGSRMGHEAECPKCVAPRRVRGWMGGDIGGGAGIDDADRDGGEESTPSPQADPARSALLAIRSHLDAVCAEDDRSIDIDHLRDLVAEGLGEVGR